MAETTDNGRISRRRKVKKLAYPCLVIAAIILAWQVHEYLQGRWRPQMLDAEAYNTTMTATTGPTWPSGGPGDVVGRGPAVAALAELAGDPGSIPPPAGATRIRSFQRKALGFIEQQGRYEYRGSASAAVEHYKTVLAARGFTLLGTRRKSTQRRTLIFAKAPIRVILSLPNECEEGKIIYIMLTVVFPAPAARP